MDPELTKLERGKYALKSINIQFAEYGEFKGKYIGKIVFENGNLEAFSFNITPDKADAYLKLMASEVVGASLELSKNLIESLGIKGIES